jgi:hypothetical protein
MSIISDFMQSAVSATEGLASDRREWPTTYYRIGNILDLRFRFRDFNPVEHSGLIVQKRKVLIRILLPIHIKVSHPTLSIIIDDRPGVVIAQPEIALKLCAAKLEYIILILVIALLVHADGAAFGVDDLLAGGAADVVGSGVGAGSR